MELWDLNCMIGRWPTAELAFSDVPGLLARMEQLGIGRAFVCHSRAWQYDPVAGNATLMEGLASHPEAAGRVFPCWIVVPTATGEQGSASELAAALARHDVRVVRLCPLDHNFGLTGPDAAELLAMLAERGVVTLIDLDQTSWEEIDHVCGAHPSLLLVVCRVGYRGLRRMAGVLARHPRCRIDLSYFGSHQGVEWAVARYGADRLLFGTGEPLVDGGGAVARLMHAGIGTAEREAIAWRHLSQLLNGAISRPVASDTAADTEATPAAQVRRGEPISGWDVVDAHGHVGPWYNFFTPDPDAETMLTVMDRCGVRQAVISSLIGVGPDAAAGNAEIANLLRLYPGRLAGYAVFNPHQSGSAADIEHWLQHPGFVGIKIHPDTHACAVGDPAYAPAWELATRYRVPVLTHTFAGSPYCDPAAFGEIARLWPHARVILGHAGATPEGHRRAIAVAQAHPNLFLELCGSFTTAQWIRRMVTEVGPDRVLYGSDFPFIDLRYGLGRVVFAGLPPDTLAMVLAGNARRLLRLPVTC